MRDIVTSCRNHTLNWRPSCWTHYPHRESSAPASSSRARKWATANHHRTLPYTTTYAYHM
jgi:hypothetical protein